MESVPLREANKRAKLFDAGITAYDFQWEHRVHVIHDDGTHLNFNYAFYMKEEEWYYIFTEHHGTHVYHEEDLSAIFTTNKEV
jgi:hypothetical protein